MYSITHTLGSWHGTELEIFVKFRLYKVYKNVVTKTEYVNKEEKETRPLTNKCLHSLHQSPNETRNTQ